MKELLSPYIGRGTWKNFNLVPLGGGGACPAKYEFGGRREVDNFSRNNFCTRIFQEGRYTQFEVMGAISKNGGGYGVAKMALKLN